MPVTPHVEPLSRPGLHVKSSKSEVGLYIISSEVEVRGGLCCRVLKQAANCCKLQRPLLVSSSSIWRPIKKRSMKLSSATVINGVVDDE